MISRVVIKNQRGRRWLTFAAVVGLLATTFSLSGSVLAVHDEVLQLDGDVSTHRYTTFDNTQIYDWGANAGNVADSTGTGGVAGQTDTDHSVFIVANQANGDPGCTDAAGCQTVSANPTTVPSVFANANFQRDFESGASCTLSSRSTTFCTADDSTYATGSKDTLGIGNGGWQCNHDANVNSKIDITNAYIASYFTGANQTGDHILYFGVEKNKTNGTNDIGVWFLQSDADCSTPTGHVNFTGSHQNGDVLVVSEFSNGGGVSAVKAFVWRASTNPASPFYGDGGCIDSRPGHFDPAVDSGCDLKEAGIGKDCKDSTLQAGDSVCATTNAAGSRTVTIPPYKQTVTTPWLTADATAGIGTNVIPPPDFFEGGINITALFGSQGATAPRCFNVGVPDTRSSASVTATLFDFVRNRIGECSSSVTTTPKDGSGTDIPGTGLPIGAGAAVQVKDHADITLTGFSGSFGGTVTFFLCGPLGLSTTTNCNDTDPVTGGDTHGVQIGSPVTVSGSGGTASVDSNDNLGVNGNTVLTSVGRYCWRAVYSGDGEVPGSIDPAKTSTSTSECFKITAKKPTLTTEASCTPASCVLGSVLNDKASLTGTAKQPGSNGIGAATAFSSAGTIDATNQALAGGTITWTLHGPGTNGAADCSASTLIANAPTPSTATVSGDKPNSGDATARYGPVSYTTLSTDKVGKYEFVATYGGNSPNTSAADDVSCDTTGANGEQVTVIGSASSASKQGWLPNDRITLSSTSGTTLKGTLEVTLYKGPFTGTRADCGVGTTATVALAKQTFNIDRTGLTPSNSVTVFTTNTTFYVGVNPSSSDTVIGTDADYFWFIHYDDNSLTDPPDRCESTTISHNDG